MKKILAALAAALTLLLAACGGGDSVPIAQCNGSPKAAVVYVGDVPFPELAAVPNACVYTTNVATVADLAVVADQARAASGAPRVYFVGAYTDLPLRYRAAYPGVSEITSIWFAPPGTAVPDIRGSIVSVHFNSDAAGAGDCRRLTDGLLALGTPSGCTVWTDSTGFGTAERAAALAQLHLSS